MESTHVAKPIRKKEKKRKPLSEQELPLSRQNYTIIGAGLLAIVAGYAAMMEGSVEGFLPLVLAPILLVLGYCVLIPVGILYRSEWFGKRTVQEAPAPEAHVTSPPAGPAAH